MDLAWQTHHFFEQGLGLGMTFNFSVMLFVIWGPTLSLCSFFPLIRAHPRVVLWLGVLQLQLQGRVWVPGQQTTPYLCPLDASRPLEQNSDNK